MMLYFEAMIDGSPEITQSIAETFKAVLSNEVQRDYLFFSPETSYTMGCYLILGMRFHNDYLDPFRGSEEKIFAKQVVFLLFLRGNFIFCRSCRCWISMYLTSTSFLLLSGMSIRCRSKLSCFMTRHILRRW